MCRFFLHKKQFMWIFVTKISFFCELSYVFMAFMTSLVSFRLKWVFAERSYQFNA